MIFPCWFQIWSPFNHNPYLFLVVKPFRWVFTKKATSTCENKICTWWLWIFHPFCTVVLFKNHKIQKIDLKRFTNIIFPILADNFRRYLLFFLLTWGLYLVKNQNVFLCQPIVTQPTWTKGRTYHQHHYILIQNFKVA